MQAPPFRSSRSKLRGIGPTENEQKPLIRLELCDVLEAFVVRSGRAAEEYEKNRPENFPVWLLLPGAGVVKCQGPSGRRRGRVRLP
jgi:hypothetical protein